MTRMFGGEAAGCVVSVFGLSSLQCSSIDFMNPILSITLGVLARGARVGGLFWDLGASRVWVLGEYLRCRNAV